MKKTLISGIIGAIVCLVSIPVHADTHWMAVQNSGSLFNGSPHSVGTTDGSTIDTISPAVTFAAWTDQAATQPGTLGKWWWLVGVSGGDNGSLIDRSESMTLQLGQNWDVTQLRFIYGYAGSTVLVSGFLSDPIATPQVYNSPDIGTMSYSSGTLSIPITATDTGGNMAMVNFGDLSATAGATLEITYSGPTGHGIALNQVTYATVPEPASLSLLALGMVLLMRKGRN
jgi:hypothetical protein